MASNAQISLSILKKEIETAGICAWVAIRYLNRAQKWKYAPDITLESKQKLEPMLLRAVHVLYKGTERRNVSDKEAARELVVLASRSYGSFSDLKSEADLLHP